MGEYALGVDVGTTFTAAAVAHGGECEPLTLGGRSLTVPSVVFVDPGGEILVGEDAEHRGATAPRHLVREFKRRLGDPAPFVVDGTPWPAEVLLAHVLGWVLARAVADRGAAPRTVTVSHPAAWGGFRIERLQQAVEQAALPSPTLIAEPAAAATFYASQRPLPAGTRVAVYDFGGGTLDVAVVEATTAGCTLLGAPQGVDFIGGVNLDDAVFDHVRSAVGGAIDDLDAEDPVTYADIAELRRQCTQAKEALSVETATSVPVRLATLRTDVRLTRDEFEDMIRPLVKETLPILRRAVQSAATAVDDLGSVLLVGGSSRIPLVGQLVAAELGRPITTDANPKLAVALGAALSTSATPVVQPRPVPLLPPVTVPEVPLIDVPPVPARLQRRRIPVLIGAAVAVVAAVAVGLTMAGGGDPSRTDLAAIDGRSSGARVVTTSTATTSMSSSSTTITPTTLPVDGQLSSTAFTGGAAPGVVATGGGGTGAGSSGGGSYTPPPTTAAPEPEPEPFPVAPDPALALSPDSGPAGTTVTATVSGFAPGEGIEIYMEADLVAVGTTDQGGGVVLTFAVPSFWADFPGESVAVDAEGIDSFGYATALFHVT